jgi:hypothetical protein
VKMCDGLAAQDLGLAVEELEEVERRTGAGCDSRNEWARPVGQRAS